MTLDRQESGPSLKILSHDIKRRGQSFGLLPPSCEPPDAAVREPLVTAAGKQKALTRRRLAAGSSESSLVMVYQATCHFLRTPATLIVPDLVASQLEVPFGAASDASAGTSSAG